MAIAKVILNGVTQMDVTQKSVTAGSMLSGATALKNDGTDITGSIASQAAQTIHPSTTDQTIASGKYLTGTQTIKAVTTTNLTAANIVQGVTVKIGDSTDDDCVASVTGTAATGGNDFVITLTYDPNGLIPDCTYAEAIAAYTGGKNVVYTSADGPVFGEYSAEEECIYLVLTMEYASGNWSALGQCVSMWTSAGVEVIVDPERESPPSFAYFTGNATAFPADVASGKTFYNINGLQTGTASGGGGSDADYIGMIERTTTATSLPSTITKIGDYAFRTCSNLALTSLPSGVTSIGKYAFDGCGSLAITALPNGITTIYEASFQGCSSITLSAIPSSVTRIETYAFTDCYQITVSVIPNAVTYIGMYAFARCENITSISCDGRVTILAAYAFNGNASHPMKLVRASFPNSAINNLPNVFGATTAANACQLLEDADIGETPSIAANAFANCYKLQTLILRKTGSICTLSNVSAFLNTPIRGYNSLTATIYVPSALISTYQTATNWSTIYGEGHVTFAAIEGSEYEL